MDTFDSIRLATFGDYKELVMEYTVEEPCHTLLQVMGMTFVEGH